MRQQFKDIEEYISSFSPEVQKILTRIRRIVKKAAPSASERISYGIPTFDLNGTYLVYFAAFANHISLYPATSSIVDHDKELAKYKVSKGTLKFPLKEEIPFGLIEKFVKYRVEENLEKGKGAGKKKLGSIRKGRNKG